MSFIEKDMEAAVANFYNQLIEAETTQDLFACVVSTAAAITNTEFAQIYLLDQSQTNLYLYIQSLLTKVTFKQDTIDNYYDDPLLQYCLMQNKNIVSDDISSIFLESNFLPQHPSNSWRSLLIMPIYNKQRHITGLLVCASYKTIDWNSSLTTIENFCRLALMQNARLVALQLKSQQSEKAIVEAPVLFKDYQYGLVGNSQAMRKVHSLISKVLHTPYTVLVTGETGTGKELVARAIHNYSSRKNKEFIVQNCASMPESLLESELFGYCKGAFTGADRDYPGLFRQADGGTLFLDEIGDMPLILQAKLLRVLQDNEVRPLGSTKTYKVDVRIITATHRDLFSEISKGNFREDLYYRLAKFPIELPPLRDRDHDIKELVNFFLDKACAFLDKEKCTPTPAFMKKLLSYSFPGNVRELKGLLERAVLLTDNDQLEVNHLHLKDNLIKVALDKDYRASMGEFEKIQLIKGLRENNGNQTKTAKQLGISRRTLIYKLQRLNISKNDISV